MLIIANANTAPEAFTWLDFGVEFIFPLLLALASAVISYFFACKSFKHEINKIKSEHVYSIKKDALLESLDFCDKYLSWLRFANDNGESSPIPVRDEGITTQNLTLEGRAIYNKLCVTCENEETINCFNELIYGSTNWSKSYQRYRNAVRKELGIDQIEMNPSKVFINRISTMDLLEKDEET